MFALDPDVRGACGGLGHSGRLPDRRRSRGRAGARRTRPRARSSVRRPSWLPFGSVDYQRHGDEASVREAIAAAADGMDALLLPGFPLTHPDHEWLGRALAERSAGMPRSGPLRGAAVCATNAGRASCAVLGRGRAGTTPVFEALPMRPRDQLRKWRAIRCYRPSFRCSACTERPSRAPLDPARREDRLGTSRADALAGLA